MLSLSRVDQEYRETLVASCFWTWSPVKCEWDMTVLITWQWVLSFSKHNENAALPLGFGFGFIRHWGLFFTYKPNQI